MPCISGPRACFPVFFTRADVKTPCGVCRRCAAGGATPSNILKDKRLTLANVRDIMRTAGQARKERKCRIMAERLISAEKLKEHYAWWENGTAEMTLAEAKRNFDTIIDVQPTVVDAITESHEKIGYDKGYRDGYAQATVDAEPVRHGRWIKQGGHYYCSFCNAQNFYAYLYNSDTREYEQQDNYCPNCGAKMDEVEDAKTD